MDLLKPIIIHVSILCGQSKARFYATIKKASKQGSKTHTLTHAHTDTDTHTHTCTHGHTHTHIHMHTSIEDIEREKDRNTL